MTSWIRQGTASVENGSTSVTGTLTLWNNQVMAGDLFRFLGEAEIYEVASDADGNNAFEIARPYAGETKSGEPYEIIPVSPRRSETPELVHRVNTYLNSVTTLVTVSGKPSESFGANGWLAIDQAARIMYRKVDGAWDDGVSLGGAGYAALSDETVTVGTGELSFGIVTGLAYVVGQRARAVAVGSEPLAWVEGVITVYDEGVLTLDVDAVEGVGTYSAWALTVTGEKGSQGDKGDKGDTVNGWTPVLAVVEDDERRVLQIVDWAGGDEEKPATGLYVGGAGLVADIGDALDIRGALGPVGPANTLAKGTVTTGDPGSEADFSITGDAPSQTLSLTIPRGDTGRGLDSDARVADLASRAAYDDEDAEFSVLVLDAADGRSAVFFKESATTADWSEPAYVTGPVVEIQPGENIVVDDTDPLQPVVSTTPYLTLTEDDAPATPASGKVALYAKDDSKLYTKNDEGVETEVGAGGSSIAVNGDTDADEIVLWDAEDGASVKSGGAPVAFLRANGALTDYAVNMLHDGGRFIAKDIPSYTAGTYAFNSSVWGLVNSASQASVAKFIYNNTDYGGNGGSLNANVKALIDTIRDPNVRRYGVEFWVAEITAGSGTSAAIVIGEDSTYLCFRQELIAVPPAATLHCYLRAITNRIWLRQYPNQVIYKWGEPFPSHVSIDPGEGWVSIMVHQILDPYSQNTYGNPSMLTVQRINAGDKFQFACPALMGGITNVNPNIGLVASASKYMP